MTEKSNETPSSTKTPAITKVEVENAGIGFSLAVIGWLAGIVLAKGGLAWVAAFFPPYGWYLAVERVMQALGLAP